MIQTFQIRNGLTVFQTSMETEKRLSIQTVLFSRSKPETESY